MIVSSIQQKQQIYLLGSQYGTEGGQQVVLLVRKQVYSKNAGGMLTGLSPFYNFTSSESRLKLFQGIKNTKSSCRQVVLGPIQCYIAIQHCAIPHQQSGRFWRKASSTQCQLCEEKDLKIVESLWEQRERQKQLGRCNRNSFNFCKFHLESVCFKIVLQH